MPDSQTVTANSDRRDTQRSHAADRYWSDIVLQWDQLGPPLRPSPEDIAFLSAVIASWPRDNGMRALILGVTPELYHLPWPTETHVLAIDNTKSMIDAIWPGPQETVICGDWTRLPLRKSSRNILLCDGGLNLLTYPYEHRLLVQILHSVIAPGGLCIFRLFVPPQKHENVEDILKDLLEAKIYDLNHLKLRLWMALQESVTQGVQLKLVWQAVHRAEPDFNFLASRIGWSTKHLMVINAYQNCLSRYFFLSVEDVRYLFCENPGGFEIQAVQVPTYPLGECCPTVILRRCGR